MSSLGQSGGGEVQSWWSRTVDFASRFFRFINLSPMQTVGAFALLLGIIQAVLSQYAPSVNKALPRHFDGWVYPVKVYPQANGMFDNMLEPEVMLWNAFTDHKITLRQMVPVDDAALTQV